VPAPAASAASAPRQTAKLSQKERKRQAREAAEAAGQKPGKKAGGMAKPVKVAVGGGTGGRGAGAANTPQAQQQQQQQQQQNGGSSTRSVGGAAPTSRYTNCLHCGKIEFHDRIVCAFCAQVLIWDATQRAAAAREIAITGVSAGVSAGAAGFGQGGAYDEQQQQQQEEVDGDRRGGDAGASRRKGKGKGKGGSASTQQQMDLKAMEKRVAIAQDAAGREAALDKAEALRAKLLLFDRTSAARSKVYVTLLARYLLVLLSRFSTDAPPIHPLLTSLSLLCLVLDVDPTTPHQTKPNQPPGTTTRRTTTPRRLTRG
jgi:hypothetical protein